MLSHRHEYLGGKVKLSLLDDNPAIDEPTLSKHTVSRIHMFKIPTNPSFNNVSV